VGSREIVPEEASRDEELEKAERNESANALSANERVKKKKQWVIQLTRPRKVHENPSKSNRELFFSPRVGLLLPTPTGISPQGPLHVHSNLNPKLHQTEKHTSSYPNSVHAKKSLYPVLARRTNPNATSKVPSMSRDGMAIPVVSVRVHQ